MQTAKALTKERARRTKAGLAFRVRNNACAGASVGADSFGRTCMVDMAKDGESADRLVYRTENYRAL